MMPDCVYKCMQVVGVNSLDRQHMFEKYLRGAALFPLYDAGNSGMQRRRVHGVMADPSFTPRALMDDAHRDRSAASSSRGPHPTYGLTAADDTVATKRSALQVRRTAEGRPTTARTLGRPGS